jgi:hypothetical protein
MDREPMVERYKRAESGRLLRVRGFQLDATKADIHRERKNCNVAMKGPDIQLVSIETPISFAT